MSLIYCPFDSDIYLVLRVMDLGCALNVSIADFPFKTVGKKSLP